MGQATKLYLKPKVRLDVKENSILVASDNKTTLNLAKQAYFEAKGRNLSSSHQDIQILNTWLENNDFWVF